MITQDCRRLSLDISKLALADVEKAYKSLNKRKREILDLIYGIEDGINRNSTEVAKIVGLSRPRVEQIRDRAISDLMFAFSHYQIKSLWGKIDYTPIFFLGLDAKTTGFLKKNGIHTIEKLTDTTRKKLGAMEFVTEKTVDLIESKLDFLGRSLKKSTYNKLTL